MWTLLSHCLQTLLCWSSHWPQKQGLLVTNLQCILRRSVWFSIWFRLLLFVLLLGAHDGKQHVQHGFHQVALYHCLQQDTKRQTKHCCVDVYLFHTVACIHTLRPTHWHQIKKYQFVGKFTNLSPKHCSTKRPNTILHSYISLLSRMTPNTHQLMEFCLLQEKSDDCYFLNRD